LKIAIITTHPIQYHSPWFELLAKGVDLHVFYTWGEQVLDKFDPGFGRKVDWDIPLLNGYEYTFLTNISKKPGSHHYIGIDNPEIINKIDSFNPDSIIVIGWNFKSHLKVLRHYKGKKIIGFRGDSTLLDERSGLKSLIRYFILKQVYSNINYVLYVGTNNKAYYKKHGLKEAQLIYAAHAIDNNRFAQQANLYFQYEIKAKLKISDNDFILLFAGKLEPKKNPLFLIDLFKLIPEERFKILFVGNGILENNIIELSEKNSRILYLPFQNQSTMPDIYKLASAFILPSCGPGETWGLALNEAMACGLPVIASNKVGGAIDLIDYGKNGYIFESGDANQAAELIKNLLKNTQLLKEMCLHSLEKIKYFSFGGIVNSILRIKFNQTFRNNS